MLLARRLFNHSQLAQFCFGFGKYLSIKLFFFVTTHDERGRFKAVSVQGDRLRNEFLHRRPPVGALSGQAQQIKSGDSERLQHTNLL